MTFAGRCPTDSELAHNYSAYSRADRESVLTRQRYRELLDGFEGYRDKQRILDVGCGEGRFLEEARRRGWEACGTELDPRAVEINRHKGLYCAQAPVEPDTFEPKSFDVITAFEFVEHIRAPLSEAAWMARVLRPGGLFHLTTPNFGSLSRRLLRGRWNVIDYPEHLLYFTPSTVVAWLRRFNFVPVNIETTGFSIARLRAGIGLGCAAQLTDEQVRTQIERSLALRTGKRLANRGLTATQLGDTLKGSFELVG